MKYNKLVRDKIPEVIKKKGAIPKIHIADEEEYEIKLKEKLEEEVKEFLAGDDEEELADILEVIDAILKFKEIGKDELELIKRQKKEDRGGFEQRIILDDVKD